MLLGLMMLPRVTLMGNGGVIDVGPQLINSSLVVTGNTEKAGSPLEA
jgi:hypothetical protein